MSWAALFERAEAFDVEQTAVLGAVAERRRSRGVSSGDGRDDQ